jgi:hypothetical protein
MSTTLEQASELSPESIAGLQASFRGEVIAPNAAGYDQARRVYNAMIDKRPALLARAVDAGDVMTRGTFRPPSRPWPWPCGGADTMGAASAPWTMVW